MRCGAPASLARSASLPGRGREWGFIFKISISSNKLRERPGAVQVSGRVGLRCSARPWQKLAGDTPTLGTTGPAKPAVGPYELCPGGSGQLPPQAPGLSGCPEHPSQGTASPVGTRGPHFCRGMPAAFPTSSRTWLLVHRPQLHWAGPGNLGQLSSVTLRGTGVDEPHPQGPGHDTHTPKHRGQSAAWPPTSGGSAAASGRQAGGQAGEACRGARGPAPSSLPPATAFPRSRLRGAMATAL